MHFLQKSRRAGLTSLRARLIMIPSAILLAGLLAAVAVVVAGGSGRVQAEVQSGMRLGAQLLSDALDDVRQSPDPDQAYTALLADLPHVRHVTFATRDDMSERPPGLLARLLAPTPQTQSFPVTVGGRILGVITMRSNPSDEIGEIRAELFTLVALLLAVWLATVALIRVAVTRGLRPLHLLGTAFDRMEHGETVSIPPVAVAELQRICGQFNRLAAALAQASADNRHLIERLMSAQEAERRELARELHDEIGPLLFGMRADAACILRWSAEGSLSNIPARALSLANHAQELQRINGRMLERMRPLVLEEMGLAEALRVLVASWRASLPDIDWVLTVPGTLAEPDRDTALTVFRIVQEALTNAARHSEAHRVEVILAERRDTLELSVRDDGRGLPERARSAAERRGYGLLGMAERVRQAGGAFSARNAPEGGTLIEARLPVPEAATCAFC
jgi:two-component system sensor histidine kinase UhpB